MPFESLLNMPFKFLIQVMSQNRYEEIMFERSKEQLRTRLVNYSNLKV